MALRSRRSTGRRWWRLSTASQQPVPAASSSATFGHTNRKKNPVLLWNLSAAIRGYLRFYMPTNRALDWLRTPCGLKWAVPAAVAVAPGYFYAMSVSAVIAARPGLGWLNILVLLYCLKAVDFPLVPVIEMINAPLLRSKNISRSVIILFKFFFK